MPLKGIFIFSAYLCRNQREVVWIFFLWFGDDGVVICYYALILDDSCFRESDFTYVSVRGWSHPSAFWTRSLRIWEWGYPHRLGWWLYKFYEVCLHLLLYLYLISIILAVAETRIWVLFIFWSWMRLFPGENKVGKKGQKTFRVFGPMAVDGWVLDSITDPKLCSFFLLSISTFGPRPYDLAKWRIEHSKTKNSSGVTRVAKDDLLFMTPD